jgi:formylglycine-generating enzyme
MISGWGLLRSSSILSTNAQFSEFGSVTGYVTVTERPLDPGLFPDAPADDLEPGGSSPRPS